MMGTVEGPSGVGGIVISTSCVQEYRTAGIGRGRGRKVAQELVCAVDIRIPSGICPASQKYFPRPHSHSYCHCLIDHCAQKCDKNALTP